MIQPQVAGVDIGSREHWVCGPPQPDGTPTVRAFGTTTEQLQALVQWLRVAAVESVAMESTSVYWIPLYELLEAQGIAVVLVKVRQLHGVPARESDVRDCQWLQQLHSCGLLRGSFRPAAAIGQLRAVARERATLGAERTRIVQRMQKALDQMNVQVHHAVSDLTGQTGMAIVRAIVAGERDPQRLATLRDRRCKQSAAEMAAHLTGSWREDHLFNLRMGLRHYDELTALLAEYDAQLAQWLDELTPPARAGATVPAHPTPRKAKAVQRRGEEPARQRWWRLSGVDLTRIDGLGVRVAEVVLTEVRPDVSAFPTEGHFVSWTRLAPRSATSAGKPVRTRRGGTGATRVATVLRMAALTVAHSPSALGAYYRRVARRRGSSVAIFATARKLAQLIYRALRYGHTYLDEGAAAYEARFQRQRVHQLSQTAQQLGYKLVPVLDAA
ncbi:MAG: IS110 family transposase [bacterium]